MLHRSSSDPNTFFVTELYTDQAALDVHQGGEVAKALGASLGDAIESADLQFCRPRRRRRLSPHVSSAAHGQETCSADQNEDRTRISVGVR